MAKSNVKLTENDAKDKAQRLSEITAQLRKSEAKMNAELNEIQQKYAEKSSDLLDEEKALRKELLDFVKKNTQLFPDNKKSFSWGSVTFSHSINPPKVGIVTGMTWEDAVEKLKKEGLIGFVRTYEEVAKDAIQLAVDLPDGGDELRGKLAKIGITITQSEKWEAKVKETELV